MKNKKSIQKYNLFYFLQKIAPVQMNMKAISMLTMSGNNKAPHLNYKEKT